MALEAIADALEALEQVGALIAIAGSASGLFALYRSATALKKTREFRAYMERERSHNKESLAGVLRGCRDTIPKVLSMRDEEMYYRSLAAVSHTLQGPLLRHEEYIAHRARRFVPALLTQLLAASTARHRRSTAMLRVAHRQVGVLLRNVESPPADPR